MTTFWKDYSWIELDSTSAFFKNKKTCFKGLKPVFNVAFLVTLGNYGDKTANFFRIQLIYTTMMTTGSPHNLSVNQLFFCFFFHLSNWTGFTVCLIYAVYLKSFNIAHNTAFKVKGRQYTASKVTEYNVLCNIVWWSIFVGYLKFISVMSTLDVSLVPRVSLRLGYRSRPIRICNDMSLIWVYYLFCRFLLVFNRSVLKWARSVGIIAEFDCYLHQRLACLGVKLSFVSPWPVLDNINFQGLFIPLIWLSTGYSFKPLGKAFVILMDSKPEPTNNQVI